MNEPRHSPLVRRLKSYDIGLPNRNGLLKASIAACRPEMQMNFL